MQLIEDIWNDFNRVNRNLTQSLTYIHLMYINKTITIGLNSFVIPMTMNGYGQVRLILVALGFIIMLTKQI